MWLPSWSTFSVQAWSDIFWVIHRLGDWDWFVGQWVFSVEVRFNPSPKISLSRRQVWQDLHYCIDKSQTNIWCIYDWDVRKYCRWFHCCMFSLMHILHVKHLFLSTPILFFSQYSKGLLSSRFPNQIFCLPMYSLDMGSYSQGLGNLPVLVNTYTWWRSSLFCVHSGSAANFIPPRSKYFPEHRFFSNTSEPWSSSLWVEYRACKSGLSNIYSVHICHVRLGNFYAKFKKTNQLKLLMKLLEASCKKQIRVLNSIWSLT